MLVIISWGGLMTERPLRAGWGRGDHLPTYLRWYKLDLSCFTTKCANVIAEMVEKSTLSRQIIGSNPEMVKKKKKLY